VAEHRPRGFRVHTAAARVIDDDRDDVTVIVSEAPAVASAVFTRSRFVGPSVTVSREAVADHRARGVVVVARNANVATGKEGLANALEVRRLAAAAVGVDEHELLVASTGVIGVQYQMDSLRTVLGALTAAADTDFDAAARAIMTTDTAPKIHSARCGDATVIGIAKGVGMLEPDMATLLTFFCTDAEIAPDDLDAAFRRVMATTFNAVSIDTDTSTSDTAAVFANGLAGPVDLAEFEAALHETALRLVRAIARDGEGATKLIEVHVRGARDDAQAKRVGKTVVNSPLVKTAVHGSDPNWGRVAMAIGKCQEEHDIDQERVHIAFGDIAVYPHAPDAEAVERLVAHLDGATVEIHIDLGIADGAFTVYGCDLTEGYVRLNSEYTT
jgi:glutamate N-acetyltransferase / amino-acid N-acetyltransferase